MNNQVSSHIYFAAFICLWSTGWVSSKFGLQYTGTFTLLALRYVVVVLILLAIVKLFKIWRPIKRHEWIQHAKVGLLSHAVYLGTGMYAMDLGVSAGLLAMIAALQPLVTAALSSATTREKASRQQWVGLLLGFAAVLLAIWHRLSLGGSLLAHTLPLIGVLAISTACVMSQQMAQHSEATRRRKIPMLQIALIHCSASLLFLAPVASITESFVVQWNVELLFVVFWLAVVVSIGAYGMMFFLLRRHSATVVSSLTYFTPPVTILFAFLLFGESLELIDIASLCLAGVAAWIVSSRTDLFAQPRQWSGVSKQGYHTLSSVHSIRHADIEL